MDEERIRLGLKEDELLKEFKSSGGASGIMQHKHLVIDANILIRAVLGSRVRGLIEHYCNSVAFYIAEANVDEAEFYLSTEFQAWFERRGLALGL